jgi:hypothetical protein
MSTLWRRRTFIGAAAAGGALAAAGGRTRPPAAPEAAGRPAKGCLTFSKLNDLGLVGACEGDMDSTLTMLISTGKIFTITHDELGCRSQFWTRVVDAESVFHNWGAGVLRGGTMTLLNRAVFYGDRVQDIKNLGTLMGFKVEEEV